MSHDFFYSCGQADWHEVGFSEIHYRGYMNCPYYIYGFRPIF